MTIASALGIEVSESDYVSDHWGVDHCDPNAWTYTPHNYEVPGVELIGGKEMKFFSDFTGFWNNPTRAEFKMSDAHAMADRIETDGIDTTCQIIYYDIDDNSRVNGGHREEAARILNIPGWMCQAVRFADEQAKIEFASSSNILTQILHKNPTVKDVESTVRTILNLVTTYDETLLKEKISFHGRHLTTKQRNAILDTLSIELRVSGKIACGDRYQEFNEDRVNKLFAEYSEIDPWLEDYWFNDDEYTIYINVANITSRAGGLLEINRNAKNADKPLHIVFSTKLPNGKETLETKREKFWTTHMQRLEQLAMDAHDMGEIHRRNYRWNHPDCEHRVIAQDHKFEKGKAVVKFPNRNFN